MGATCRVEASVRKIRHISGNWNVYSAKLAKGLSQTAPYALRRKRAEGQTRNGQGLTRKGLRARERGVCPERERARAHGCPVAQFPRRFVFRAILRMGSAVQSQGVLSAVTKNTMFAAVRCSA